MSGFLGCVCTFVVGDGKQPKQQNANIKCLSLLAWHIITQQKKVYIRCDTNTSEQGKAE